MGWAIFLLALALMALNELLAFLKVDDWRAAETPTDWLALALLSTYIAWGLVYSTLHAMDPPKPKRRTWGEELVSNFMFMFMFMGTLYEFLAYLDPNDPDIAKATINPFVFFFFILPLTVLLIQAGLKRGQLAKWWQAWDGHGRPIDVEVLDPAPITKRD
jgi:hypothetical protein